MFAGSRVFLLLTVLGFVAYTEQQLKDPEFMKTYAEYQGQCATEWGVDLVEVKKFWEEHHFPSDNQNLNCYFKCMNLQLGIITETGDVNDDKLRSVSVQFNDEATGDEIVEECGHLEGADLCETAIKLMTCVRLAQLD